jgi:hypothetical protein
MLEIDFKSNSLVVNQLWPIIKSIINSRVSDMKMLLSIFHVKEKSRTPFIPRFDTVDELLALYIKAFEGDMTKDEENDNACELEASKERERILPLLLLAMLF